MPKGAFEELRDHISQHPLFEKYKGNITEDFFDEIYVGSTTNLQDWAFIDLCENIDIADYIVKYLDKNEICKDCFGYVGEDGVEKKGDYFFIEKELPFTDARFHIFYQMD